MTIGKITVNSQLYDIADSRVDSLATVASSGSYNDLDNKPIIPTVPTNISAFNNDSGYLTQHLDISGKQDVISDLTTIRSGAAAGATAQQPATTLAGYGITDAYTKTEADNGFVTKETFEQSTTPWYGIRWSQKNPTPVRIGNMELHKTLPILSLMRRCIVTDNGEVRYIPKQTGTINTQEEERWYNGSIGQCMVEIPEYPYEITSTITGILPNRDVVYELKLYINDTLTSKKSKKVYIGAFEAMSDDASGTSTPKLYSISNISYNSGNTLNAADITYQAGAASYRGGGARTDSSWDSLESSQLGRPVTNLTRDGFRTRAANRGTGWSQQYWDAYMAMVRLYVVEYCSFNVLDTFISSLTEDGYHQGGLGPGVSTISSSTWSTFNGYNPIVPCGVTRYLGDKTGIVSYTTSSFTVLVPSYRGIENPFGHIWKWTDGINILGNTPSGFSSVYTCSDITKFADDTSTNYILRTEIAPYGTEGYIKACNIDEKGDFIPIQQGGSSDSYYYDYSWFQNAGWKVLYSGGDANYGAFCGLFCFVANYGSGLAAVSRGGRLYYTPTV